MSVFFCVPLLLTNDSRFGQISVSFSANSTDRWQQTWSNVRLFLCKFCWQMTADLVKCLFLCHFCWQMTANVVKCLSLSVCHFCWQMTANLVKCLSLFMQILPTYDSRLGQMSISVQVLLTDDSRLAQMSVRFCATHTNFEKCGAVVAFNVGDVADTSGNSTASTINSTFSDRKGIRIYHNSGICTRIHGVTAILQYPTVWSHQVCQMICCYVNNRWTTYVTIRTANLHNKHMQFSHTDATFALLPITSSVTFTDSNCPSIKASSWQADGWTGENGVSAKIWTRHQPNTRQTCYHLNRQDMMIPRLVGYDAVSLLVWNLTNTHPIAQCHVPVDLSDRCSITMPRTVTVSTTPLFGAVKVFRLREETLEHEINSSLPTWE